MKKYKIMIVALLALTMFAFVGCNATKENNESELESAKVKTFADWTKVKVFQDVPAMVVKGTRIGEAIDCGADTYVLTVNGTTKEDYETYLGMLEEAGYEKYVNNGEEGLASCVFSTSYIKADKVVTITHMAKTKLTHIAVSEKLKMSEHLFYSENYLAGNQEGAQTSLHLMELHTYGDSYVIKMKNGKFLLIDGGMEQDTRYLLDYLENMVPQGEKPVVEGWFITHGHADHIGPFTTFVNSAKYAERIVVEGVYFSEPSNEVCSAHQVSVENVKYGTMACKTSEGKVTPIYRPQTGQRYYFNDITIDILHTQEQLLLEEYENGFNDSSTWLLFTIDGQTFLDAGDASEGAINVVKRSYNQEYFDLDMISVFHHGQNVYESYVNYFNYKTAIYPTFVEGSQTADHKVEENATLRKNAVECFSWGDGTKVLTFPYKLGTAKSLPMREWTYNPDRVKPAPFK